ncbi:unnamed protein product [Cunninghamella blakesleeana]
MTTVSISNKRGENIVGVLEKKPQTNNPNLNKRLILIAHGALEHKNVPLLKQLAENLPYSNFRFDFRGYGESSGEFHYANFEADIEDLYTVANYFEKEGYEIWAVIGHSRGTISCFKYASSCEKPLAHVINISGRYDMNEPTVLSNLTENKKQLEEQNHFIWSFKKDGKIQSRKVTNQEVNEFTSWDHSFVAHMPKVTNVFTCHGLADELVSPYNAALFANNVPTHTLKLIPGANHNFIGKTNELMTAILDYFEEHEKNAYIKVANMGQHTSLCIPRWIDVKGVKNFRDIGGWPIKDGSGYIRERIVFRCGHLADISEEGIEILKRLNVIAAFDFRSDPEVERQGVGPTIQGLTRYPSAMFTEADYSPAALASRWKGYFEGPLGFPKVYNIILEKSKEQFRKIFLHMLDHHSNESTKSLIIHCTAGKDRTGVFIMLLLGLCGVDEEIIAREYSLSNLGYWEPEDHLEKRAELLGTTVENMRMVMSAPYLAMKETIRQLNERYGSAEGYLKTECKLTDEQLQSIRQLMIVPIRFEQKQLFRPKI